MQPVSNPRSRFAEHYLEWDEAPPPAELQVFEDSTRGILAKNDSPDLPFRYSLNPYRGCSHACAYCYARPSHEWLGFGAGSDFDSKIVVKLQAPELLAAAFAKKSWTGELVLFSGDTDCYQPLEAHYKLTRRCLEVARDAGNPVGIITKSYLVTRDRDILAALAREQLLSMTMSICFADDDLARLMEPGAPRPSKRFAAIRELTDAGIAVRLLLAPVIPGLNDEQIPAILERAAAAGAVTADLIALRLPLSVKDVFLNRLNERVPLRAARVEARVREMRGGKLYEAQFGQRFRGEGPYWDAVESSFRMQRKRFGLDRVLPRSLHAVPRPRNLPPSRQPSLFAEADPAQEQLR